MTEIQHEGVIRRSGRYPWGSGENPYQRSMSFLSAVKDLESKGLSEIDVAKGLGMTTAQLRARKSIARNEKIKEEEAQVLKLKAKNYSNVAIGERLGINESVVRERLRTSTESKMNATETTAAVLKSELAKKKMLDIGEGTEQHLGVPQSRLKTAVQMLQDEGYVLHRVKVPQLGTSHETQIKILVEPGIDYKHIVNNLDKIGTPAKYSPDGGRTFLGIRPPENVDSKRIEVRYGPDGGSDMDGVIQLRRGVSDLDLGNARYAQVRVAVDGTHYLKGMAMYSDDLPKGVDIRFNTNKNDTGNKKDALKKLSEDPDNPFGAQIKAGGQRGALNILNEEGDWSQWSKSISSQVLSKQNLSLAKQQLGLKYDATKADLDEIVGLTNPTIKKKLLQSFADGADSQAVKLKAKALPGQATHVLLPMTKVKPNEIYAPNYKDGENVVLIRFPHGGKFEIPELTVNNKNPEAKSIIQNAKDAVGIHPKVAAHLSGADFDGDTVLVIPNGKGAIKTSPQLQDLKDFDPQAAYPGYSGMKRMSEKEKGLEMGKVSNLITDMTIRGANSAEIAKAVRHSMVVIDAEKHKLNYKQSEKDNEIAMLKKKYQGSSKAGASTLVSRSSSEVKISTRVARSAKDGGGIDPVTGKKVYVEKPTYYTNKNGEQKERLMSVARGALTDDAHTLSSGTPMEAIYADHANKMKALANEARKELLRTPPLKRDPSAAAKYAKEVDSLKSNLNLAFRNKPLERQAQLLGNSVVRAKRQANPDLSKDELLRIKRQALQEARRRTGAWKQNIVLTPNHWDAIQAGAVSEKFLQDVLDNTDLDQVRKLATPKTMQGLTSAKMSRAKSMLAMGYTQNEVASALGVSTSAITDVVS